MAALDRRISLRRGVVVTGARKAEIKPQDKPHVRMLKGIRQARHWSQMRLAIELEVRSNTIWRWENGLTEPSAHSKKLINFVYEKVIHAAVVLPPDFDPE